jgi:predicted transcriptional regulator
MTRLDIHVGGSFADTKRRTIDAVKRSQSGEAAGEDHVTFETWEALAKVMTTKRFELVRHLHRHPEASIAALARSLKRDYKRVHQDVDALSKAGLITLSSEGLRAEYDEIQTRIAI